MAKQVNIKETLQIIWFCDQCGKEVKKKGRYHCALCNKLLCKTCKHHFHWETGSGNGLIPDHKFSKTGKYCLSCFEELLSELEPTLLKFKLKGNDYERG